MTQIDEHIGQRIRTERRRRDLSQAELGRKVGTSHQQVHKYENAINRVSAALLFTLATALEVPVGDLYPRQET